MLTPSPLGEGWDEGDRDILKQYQPIFPHDSLDVLRLPHPHKTQTLADDTASSKEGPILHAFRFLSGL
jgi:hypothetical protein